MQEYLYLWDMDEPILYGSELEDAWRELDEFEED